MSRPTRSSPLVPSGAFVVRTPLLPFGSMAATSGRTTREEGRAWLAAMLARPLLREAIHLASPRVHAGIDTWQADPEGDEPRRLEPVLVSYALRVAGRPTPFGLFAGWTTGIVAPLPDSRTSLRLKGSDRYRRHSRLDVGYLAELAQAIGEDRRWRRALLHRPNPTLHDAAGRLHFTESRFDNGCRSYHLVAIDPSPFLLATLARAGAGPGGVALDELAASLVDGDVSGAEAAAFIDELVDRQVLVADLGPAVTGTDPGLHLIGRLAATPATAPLARPLEDAHLALAALDDGPITGADRRPPAERYEAVATALRDLPGRLPDHRFVRVDLEKPAEDLTLGSDVVAVIREGIELLRRLAPRDDDAGLARFREEFVARYDSRAVPLAEALDDESGIGFERTESPAVEAPDLLGDIPLPGTAPDSEAHDGRRAERDAALLRRLGSALWTKAAEIELTPADVTELEALAGGPPLPLPGALAAVVRLAARSAADLAAGRFRVYLPFVGGPSGAELLGRLCGADKTLRAGVEAHLRAEEAQRPDAVFAEIVHLPEGRSGNVLVRPVLRPYEIPYLGQSGAPKDAQIPVSDMLVSVRDERIVLESASLGVEVLPRLTSAHLHSRPGLALYRFLVRLQYQAVAAELEWDWGTVGAAPFLPRVVAGRVVLSLARWHLAGPDVDRLRAAGPARAEALAAWRTTWRVPRFVALVDGEDELLVDLDSELALDALAHQLRERTTATFVEMFPGPDQLCVTGPEGSFVHDLIVPFVTEPAEAPEPGPRRAPSARRRHEAVRRSFPPGSEWLYAKLYTGPAAADRVLLDTVAPLAAETQLNGAADRWFFVRYADPDPHLRVRFAGRPERLLRDVLPALQAAAAALIDDGVMWRLQLDTYEREIERYGGDEAIDLAEELFAADSEAVIDVLKGPAGRPVADLRWRAALVGIARLVVDLGLDEQEQRRLAAESCAGYGAEFGVDRRFRQAVSRRFRRERSALEALVAGPAGSGGDLAPEWRATSAAFDRRSARIRPVVAELRRLAAAGRLAVPFDDLAASLAHMHVNRMLRAAPRVQELVLYEFLDRLWAARTARPGRQIEELTG